MKEGLIESLRTELARDPTVGRVVAAILDRCDMRGVLPKQMILRCNSPEERDAAVRLLSAGAARGGGRGDLSVRLDLARADERLRADGGPSLCDILYAAVGRTPKNRRGELGQLGQETAGAALALAVGRTGAARAFLNRQAQKLPGGRGEMFRLACAAGLSRVQEELEVTARCIELAEQNEQPVRLANFARRATGTTKGLRAGDRRYTRVTDALLQHLTGLGERVDAEGLRELSDRRRLALECLGIFRNETPIDVLCYGHIVFEKRGRRLNAPAAYHDLGEPCRMLLLNLRDAQIAEVQAERVVSIENETTFNDYVEWVRTTGRREVVLLSEGQANWAVVRLLRLLALACPGLPILHWGDLDRHGVLILRSLRRRSGVAVEPLWMDAATFHRFAKDGQDLPDEERNEIAALVAGTPGDVGTDLLHAIRGAGQWVEQETVAEEVLGLGSMAVIKASSTP